MSVNSVQGTSWVTTNTAPRVAPSEGPSFREVMNSGAQTLVRGATEAVRSLPLGPMVATSVRPSVSGINVAARGSAGAEGLAPSAQASAEGPGGSTVGAGAGQPDMESALQRSEEMNMYMLGLQSRVAAQNRAFTTYSNVLKARHDTVKGVINNIR